MSDKLRDHIKEKIDAIMVHATDEDKVLVTLINNEVVAKLISKDDPLLLYQSMQPFPATTQPLTTAGVVRYDTEVMQHQCLIEGKVVLPDPCEQCGFIDTVLSAVNSILIANGIVLNDNDLRAMGNMAKKYRKEDQQAEMKKKLKGLLHEIGIDLDDIPGGVQVETFHFSGEKKRKD